MRSREASLKSLCYRYTSSSYDSTKCSGNFMHPTHCVLSMTWQESVLGSWKHGGGDTVTTERDRPQVETDGGSHVSGEKELEQLGYRQELRRTLSLVGNLAPGRVAGWMMGVATSSRLRYRQPRQPAGRLPAELASYGAPANGAQRAHDAAVRGRGGGNRGGDPQRAVGGRHRHRPGRDHGARLTANLLLGALDEARALHARRDAGERTGSFSADGPR